MKYKTKSIKIKKKIDEKRAITPWGRSSHAEHVCSLNLTSTCTSDSFWNKMKSIKILQIWWKKGNNSKMGNQIYFKIAV